MTPACYVRYEVQGFPGIQTAGPFEAGNDVLSHYNDIRTFTGVFNVEVIDAHILEQYKKYANHVIEEADVKHSWTSLQSHVHQTWAYRCVKCQLLNFGPPCTLPCSGFSKVIEVKYPFPTTKGSKA